MRRATALYRHVKHSKAQGRTTELNAAEQGSVAVRQAHDAAVRQTHDVGERVAPDGDRSTSCRSRGPTTETRSIAGFRSLRTSRSAD